MSIAAALPKIRQLIVLPPGLRPARLMIATGGILALLSLSMILITASHQRQGSLPVSQPASNPVISPNTELEVPAEDPAAVNVIHIQPAGQPVSAGNTAQTHFASFDINSSLLPGNALPTSARCGITHRSPDQGNKVVRDCYARNVSGYALVHFVADTSTGGILSTTFYVRKLLVRDLINQWGPPLGYRTNNASSVIYWAGKRAYLTSARLRGSDRIQFISFDDTEQHYQPWGTLAD